MLDGLGKKLTDIARYITGKAHISENNIQEALNEIKIALLEADVNVRVVRRFINSTQQEALGEKVLRSVSPGQQFVKLVYDKMVQLLGDKRQDLQLKGPDTQSVILFVGLQGSGKTTTAAKLAYFLKGNKRNPLLVAADLRRPAAVEQLNILGKQTGIEVYSENQKNPVSVVSHALKHAKKNQFDTVIIDTSGRLQIDAELMKEIKDVKKAADPDEILLVADSMTGQNAVDIAREFDEQLGLSGIILSKFDSDAKGGAAFSIKSISGKPIKFIGVGEKIQDLDPFYPDRIASRILGMGDVVSLVEKAQATMDLEEAEKLQEKMASLTFDLEDYLSQIQKVTKMGSLQSLMEMIPGMKGNLPENAVNDRELKKEEAIILSMTKAERKNYRIIGPRRRSRIARGSGMSVFNVNQLLKKFEKAKLMMKKATKNSKYQKQLMSQMGNINTNI
ncbi:MAG: signal recognition particle protein [Spirochaetales bacterium]|nr:signal recognition particle protein [Spirochaetales bacterium]